jgi:hypothetical protein
MALRSFLYYANTKFDIMMFITYGNQRMKKRGGNEWLQKKISPTRSQKLHMICMKKGGRCMGMR